MTETAVHPSIQPAHGTPKPPPTGWHRLLAPGWLRAPWMTALFFAIGTGIVVGIRSLAGWDPVWDWVVIVTVAGLSAPFESMVIVAPTVPGLPVPPPPGVGEGDVLEPPQA